MRFRFFLQERATDESAESESFRELLTARTQEFIEEILAPHFGGMMTFVKDAEAWIEQGETETLKNSESTQQLFCRESRSSIKHHSKCFGAPPHNPARKNKMFLVPIS